MSVNTQGVKERLTNAGAVDVKFFFNADFSNRYTSEVKAQANFLLGMYLDGQTTPRSPVGQLTHIS
jgi:hypothetical protein